MYIFVHSNLRVLSRANDPRNTEVICVLQIFLQENIQIQQPPAKQPDHRQTPVKHPKQPAKTRQQDNNQQETTKQKPGQQPGKPRPANIEQPEKPNQNQIQNKPN